MAILEHKENLHIQAFFNAYKRELAPIKIAVDDDMHAWKALLSDAQAVHDLSKPLDPDLNDIRPNEGFWVALKYEGNVIACVGARVLDARDDFVREWITTYRLFGDRTPRLDFESYELAGDIPRIKGIVGFGGGSWVHPDWRKLNLSSITSRLGKVIALSHWRLDFYTAMIMNTDNRKAWAKDNLGWPNSEFLTTGHHPGRDKWLCHVRLHWMNTDDILRVARDLDFIAPSVEPLRSRLVSLIPEAELSGGNNVQRLRSIE